MHFRSLASTFSTSSCHLSLMRSTDSECASPIWYSRCSLSAISFHIQSPSFSPLRSARITSGSGLGLDSPRFSQYSPFLHAKSARSFLLFFLSICLSLLHISEPTRLLSISYAVFCLKKKKKNKIYKI